MIYSHNVKRQLSYIRQCLADDKKPISLLIGAGCPFSIKIKNADKELPLIPDIPGLTKVICEGVGNVKECKNTLQDLLSQFINDGNNDPNVEEILSHIRSLRVVVGNDKVRGLTLQDLDTLDKKICEHIVLCMNKILPDSNTPYHKVASWVGGIHRDFPVEIFTTNYDLLLEQAFEENHVLFFDGFVGSRKAIFSPHAMEETLFPSGWNMFWKIHGSINWYQDEKNEVYRGGKIGDEQLRIIHPSHLKYSESRRMPYLAMIDRLRSFFKKPSPVMITCGYSFRDQHINEIIMEGLRSNPNSIVFGLLFGSLKDYPDAINLAVKRVNLSLLSEDEAIIGTIRAPWAKMQETEEVSTLVGINWDAKKEEQNGENETQEIRNVFFNLGDFNIFGDFLGDIIRMKSETEVTPDAQ